jgi:hypothetical protein
LFDKGGLPAKKEIEYPNIIEILFGGESFSLKSGASGGQLTYAEFKDANGNTIAYYNNGGWNECNTDAENVRIQEFLHIYNDAWRAEYKGESGTRNSEGAFDITV